MDTHLLLTSEGLFKYSWVATAVPGAASRSSCFTISVVCWSVPLVAGCTVCGCCWTRIVCAGGVASCCCWTCTWTWTCCCCGCCCCGGCCLICIPASSKAFFLRVCRICDLQVEGHSAMFSPRPLSNRWRSRNLHRPSLDPLANLVQIFAETRHGRPEHFYFFICPFAPAGEGGQFWKLKQKLWRNAYPVGESDDGWSCIVSSPSRLKAAPAAVKISPT